MNVLERFIKQLDDLMMIQGVTNVNTYDYIKNNHTLYMVNNIIRLLPYDYQAFQKIVNNSLLVLAYSYFEAFLID